MKKNKVLLVLNGAPIQRAIDFNQYDKIVCTDGAQEFLIQKEITPQWVSGDFDSLTQKKEGIIYKHTPNQDFTDFEKALQILIEEGVESLDVINASGKEQDHFLGNLTVALKYKSSIKIQFTDDYSTYFLIDKSVSFTTQIGKIISVYPFPKIQLKSSIGLKYPLNNLKFKIDNRIGARNQAIANKVVIEWKSGKGFLFIAH